MLLYNNEKGIAIILALLMLLVMSVLALTVSFMSNINFQSMSNFKRGQESFLAAESCINVGRNKLETIGIETLFFELQIKSNMPNEMSDSGEVVVDSDIVIFEALNNDIDTDPDNWKDPMCRSGSRVIDNDNGIPNFITQPAPTKVTGRPLKNVSLPSGGTGGSTLVPIVFNVTGKDSRDKDKADRDLNINTGTEIAIGFETFIPGGATNIYSGQ